MRSEYFGAGAESCRRAVAHATRTRPGGPTHRRLVGVWRTHLHNQKAPLEVLLRPTRIANLKCGGTR